MDAGIAGELLATLTGMAGATKAVAEAMKTVKSKVKGNAEAERALAGALDHVLTLQTRMIDLQATVLSLQQELAQAQRENVGLREQIRTEEKRATDRQQYQRKQVGKAVVLIREDEPNTYYCPACFETAKVALPLQAHPMRSGSFGSHYCNQCKGSYRVSR